MSAVLPHYRNPVPPILFSMALAMLLTWLPWHGWALALRPDFIAVVLLYWTTHTPHKVGISTAWFVGLLADVADASLFGQHALAYSALALGSSIFKRRILMLDLSQQTMQVFPLLLVNYLVFAAIDWVAQGHFAWSYLPGCVTSALLWLPLTLLLQALSRPRAPKADSL
ncbi:rod shape-determining protein MreD [Ferriphaselus sp. R-1]|uniref:rod shape-determining protein MreD n=1 Tax=Ferriphaselus sp. R-1 TaxID=1485544 RepID=UPI0005573999|nr:rod shape-determining protein MreD [Ferriphaselus sp. R-1]